MGAIKEHYHDQIYKECLSNTVEGNVKEAIKVILSDTKAYSKTLNYAVRYCETALSLEGYELQIQCLYILNNITRWRHSKAKAIRVILKNFVKDIS